MEMEKRLEPKLQKNLKIQKVFQMSDLKIDIFAHFDPFESRLKMKSRYNKWIKIVILHEITCKKAILIHLLWRDFISILNLPSGSKRKIKVLREKILDF